MMKKRIINRKIILLYFLMFSCLFLNGCYSKEGHYRYTVKNINGGDSNISEGYYYYYRSDYFEDTKLWYHGIERFSIADQDIIECMKSDEPIEAYAVSDQYIFFSTNKTGKDPYYLWKYDRIAGTYEILLETESLKILWIGTYGDWIIYGRKTDLNVCSMEKNLETDSISLNSLLDEESMQKQQVGRNSYVQEFLYQGWRVLFYRNGSICEILGIVEEDSGEVILSTQYLGAYPDCVFWREGKWIIFSRYPGSSFYYQREGETEQHKIECLRNRKYDNTRIDPSCLTMEGNCVFGMMSVNRGRGPIAYDQSEIEHDILFELNLETNASKIIYETDSARTRILGYKYGVIYLLEDDVIYKGWIDRPEREKIYDLQEEGWELYRADGEHINISFTWWGNNLIMRSGDQIRSIHISEASSMIVGSMPVP